MVFGMVISREMSRKVVGKWAYDIEKFWQTGRQMNGRMDRQTERQMERQTDRETDRETDS